jgi:aminoglycoside phosphotransferase (APT) family kinase protein
MANTLQLLGQIRRAAAAAGEATSRSRAKSLLDAVDIALNTLQLQESPGFYLDHIASGKALVTEGSRLLSGSPVRESSVAADPQGDLRATALDAKIGALRQALAAIVAQLDEGRSAAAKDFLVRMSDWETRFYTHHLEQAPQAPSVAPAVTREGLQAYLERRFPGWTGLKVTEFTPLDGGFSKNTILFATDDRVNGVQELVLRAEQPFDLLCYEGSDVTREFFMIQLMRNSGLPTAEPLWLEADAQHLGCRFIVSRKAHGRVYGGALGSDEKLPAAAVRSVMAAFVQMHNIRIAPGDALARRSHLEEWLPHAHSLRATTEFYVGEWLPRLIRRTGIPASPQVERALQWLRQHVPESDETPVVLHGDFSFNNLIIADDGVTAVLDWESSRLGDPAEDIVWTQPNLGAYLTMPEFLEIYRAGTGREIPERRLAYSRVVKCVLNAVACLSARHGLETRSDTSITLATLAYKYMGLFGAQFNSLIESAERV